MRCFQCNLQAAIIRCVSLNALEIKVLCGFITPQHRIVVPLLRCELRSSWFCCSVQVSKEANNALLDLQPCEEGGKVDTTAVLAVISREIRSEQEPTRLEALRW